jgi:hypothetical protein
MSSLLRLKIKSSFVSFSKRSTENITIQKMMWIIQFILEDRKSLSKMFKFL